jgi:hypothetical protein
MSLYNLMFGVNPAANVLLATLGLTQGDVPRFRDCFIQGKEIIIHTRTGGGNRESYEEENEELTRNPFYIGDEDDDFDSTYANFAFRFPEEYADDLEALASRTDTRTPSEKWQALFNALEKVDRPTGEPPE